MKSRLLFLAIVITALASVLATSALAWTETETNMAGLARAQAPAYTDDEVKAQFVKAGMFCHADFIRGGYQLAFEMVDGDTNRYARILRELAVENINETEWAIASLGKYKPPPPEPSVPVFLLHECSLWSTGHEVDIRNRGSDEQFHSSSCDLRGIDKFVKAIKNEGENMVQYSQQVNCRKQPGRGLEKIF